MNVYCKYKKLTKSSKAMNLDEQLQIYFKGLDIMKKYEYPIIFDATHSVQLPGGMGSRSGGQREHIPPLCKAAISIGVAGLFLETHNDPDNAPSDGPNMINIKYLKNLLIQLKQFDDIAKNNA